MKETGVSTFWSRFKSRLCYGFKPPPQRLRSEEFYGALRKLRMELVDLVKMTARAKEGQVLLQDYSEYIDKTFTDVELLISRIEQEEGYSDTIRHILNLWEQIRCGQNSLKADHSNDSAGFLQFLSVLEEQAREMVLYIGVKTIPPRINDWLKDTHAGNVLPFHFLFEDEFMRDEDRQQVLDYISWKPKAIQGGIVNPDTGLIYRYPDCLWVRVLRNTFTLAVIIALTYCIYEFGEWFFTTYIAGSGTSESLTRQQIFPGWIALLAGVAVHLLVAKTKERNTRGRRSIMPISVWSHYLSAHTASMLFKIGLALFAYIGLLVVIDVPKFNVAQAFLVGYSLNSFVGIFAANIESRAAAQINAMKK